MKIFTIFLLIIALQLSARPVDATSEDACAIWLCLPGGFPQGCSGAYKEFKHRIKKGKSPLPDLRSCTTGPKGGHITGSYELGYEQWVPCKDGYVMREYKQPGSYRASKAQCYRETCAPRTYTQQSTRYCDSYKTVRRKKPQFVKMWVDGSYLGQYFY